MKDYSSEKRIFHHIDELFDDYHELPEVREADEELKKYLKENFLDGEGEEVQKKWLELTDMVNHAEAESELQGFIFGFRYAVELFAKGDRLQRSKSGRQDSVRIPDAE